MLQLLTFYELLAEACVTYLTATGGAREEEKLGLAKAKVLQETLDQVNGLLPVWRAVGAESVSDLAPLRTVLGSLQASKTSFRDDWKLYRSIVLLPVGEQCKVILSDLVAATSWGEATASVTLMVVTKFEDAANAKSFEKVYMAVRDFRAVVGEDATSGAPFPWRTLDFGVRPIPSVSRRP